MTLDKNAKRDAWGTLMRAALAGDDAAYRALLAEVAEGFRRDVSGRLTRGGQGNADCEDIVQEALLAVHLKRGTWDSSRPFAPWAYAVLAHKFVDRMRYRHVRPAEPLEQAMEISAVAEEAGAGMDTARMLDALAPAQRRIVTAISLEGRTPAEVARTIGSTEGAVRVALHRALKRLAQVYREDKNENR